MSNRTEYRSGDRVFVAYAGYSGNATVVGGPVTVSGFANPSYVIRRADSKSEVDVDVVYHGALHLVVPKPHYALEEIKFIVTQAAGVCLCRFTRAVLCGVCQAKSKIENFTPTERAMAAPYVPAPGFVQTLRLNVESVPDTDAFIDKVADRVAAKVSTSNAQHYSAIVRFMEKITEQFRGITFASETAPKPNYSYADVPSRYVTATDKQSIKEQLVQGKIVNAPRNSGKTTAILELLRENPGKYVAVYKDQRTELDARRHYDKMFYFLPKLDDTDHIGSGQNNGDRLALYDEITDLGNPKMFAAVYTAKP